MNTTKDRLEQYHAMVKAGASQQDIRDFVTANNQDKRFVSLVELGEEFLSNFESTLRARMDRDIAWYFWKFVHNLLIHPLLALPWEPKWARRAHDWTAQRCKGGG